MAGKMLELEVEKFHIFSQEGFEVGGKVVTIVSACRGNVRRSL